MLKGLQLRERLPHRYPFLLLDEVTDLGPDKASGFKNVTFNEPYFRGHFPEAPVLPGVLVLESLLQLIWVMYAGQGGFRLRKVRKLRFRRPVVPGDRLELEVEIVEQEQDLVQLRAQAKVEGALAAQGLIWVAPGRESSSN